MSLTRWCPPASGMGPLHDKWHERLLAARLDLYAPPSPTPCLVPVLFVTRPLSGEGCYDIHSCVSDGRMRPKSSRKSSRSSGSMKDRINRGRIGRISALPNKQYSVQVVWNLVCESSNQVLQCLYNQRCLLIVSSNPLIWRCGIIHGRRAAQPITQPRGLQQRPGLEPHLLILSPSV